MFSCYGASSRLNTLRFITQSLEQRKFDLFKAALSHDAEKVSALINFGTPVNFLMSAKWRLNRRYADLPAPAWGNLPLIHVLAMSSSGYEHDIDILNALITAGADVNITYEIDDHDQCKASGSILHNVLHIHRRFPVFLRLIEANADVNATNSKGISVVTALLTINSVWNHGSDHNREDKIALLKLFIHNGARLSEDDIANMLALVASEDITDSDIDLLNSCISKGITPLTPKTGNLLHSLASKLVINSPIKKEFIEKILKSGVDLNGQDENGRTPLYLAAKANNATFMTVLVDQHDEDGRIIVDVNLPDNEGVTPLHRAAKSSEACLIILLDYQANKDAKDNNGATVVAYAAGSYALEELLKHKPKFDIPDKAGVTPLMQAVAGAILSNTTLLINAGANIWAKTNNGQSVLDCAVSTLRLIESGAPLHSDRTSVVGHETSARIILAYLQGEMTMQQHALLAAPAMRLS